MIAKRRLLALGFVSIAIALVACGSDRPRAAESTTGVGPAGAGGFGGNNEGSDKPPGCGQKDDGTYCDCLDTPLFSDPPNMYFVLDRSGSMIEGDKWNKVRLVVAKIMRSLGPRANFGATIYPANVENCAAGKEVLPTRRGDPPSTKDGPTTTLLLNATAGAPNGGTPTAATLQAVLPIVTKLPGKTFVILATDGGPNCNSATTCTFATCQPNVDAVPGCPINGPSCCTPPIGTNESCIDGDSTYAAVSALYARGIPTYVIGLPGTSAYAALLDKLAVAGGTAQQGTTKYYSVDLANEEAMLGALKKVAAKITATCEFKLSTEPSDQKLVNVYIDEVVLPYDPVNTWKIEGKTVTLLGATCAKVQNGDVLDVRIITGCPRVEPR